MGVASDGVTRRKFSSDTCYLIQYYKAVQCILVNVRYIVEVSAGYQKMERAFVECVCVASVICKQKISYVKSLSAKNLINALE